VIAAGKARLLALLGLRTSHGPGVDKVTTDDDPVGDPRGDSSGERSVHVWVGDLRDLGHIEGR
jgi:hypothetical protein